ncbi:MAG TPA: hypothetical protein VMP13_10340 [Acidimicrobiia bacterium]|nr:hypothetical protein [Acidimicrobiia bacterium]
MSARIGVVAMGLVMSLLTACGDDSEVPTVLVTDQCRVEGPQRVAEGSTRLTLQRTGLGDYGAAVVHFDNGHVLSELEAHFDEVSQVWEERPEWVRIRYFLEVDDDDVTSPTGDTVMMDLQPGEYAIVCINFSDDRARVPVTLEVVAER